LVINELPVICGNNKMELKEGNAIALEPKFVINGVGAVGTENSFIVKNNGMEKITFAPEEIIEL
jgi:Xaa-Pro aminopeptidase